MAQQSVARSNPVSSQTSDLTDPVGSRSSLAWHSDWGNLVLAGLLLYVAAYIAFLPFQTGDNRIASYAQELAYLPVMATGVLFAFRAARSGILHPQARRAWAVIGVSFLIWLVADGFWAYYTITRQSVPLPSWTDAAFMIKGLVLVGGILMFPASGLSRPERTRFWLDSGIIVLGLAVLTASLIIGPGLLEFTDVTVDAFILFAYPVTHTLALVALYSIFLRRPRENATDVLVLFGAGLVVYAITDLWWAFLDVRGMFTTGGVAYAFWMIAQALLVASPQRHYDITRRRLVPVVSNTIAERLRSRTPYAALAVALAAVLFTSLPEFLNRFGIVTILMLALLALFIFRQVATHQENVRLSVERVKRENEERFQALVEHSSDMITVLDQDLRCRFQSPSALEVTGQQSNAFTGTQFPEWILPADREHVLHAFDDVLNGVTDRARLEWRMQRPGLPVLHLETIVTNELSNPTVGGLVLNSRDVTERKILEERLTHQAYHDPLTGLPNRAHFVPALEQALRNLERSTVLSVIFFDLDRLKQINDTFGHETGDALLVALSERITRLLRPGDTFDRLAGDEFTVLLTDLASESGARRVAERLRDGLQEPLDFAGQSKRVSISIGIAVVTSKELSAESVIGTADAAMYAAKRAGAGQIHLERV